MNSFRKILPLNKFIFKIEEFYKSMYYSSENSARKTLLDAPDSPFKHSRHDREEAEGREGGDRVEEGGRDRDEESCVETLEIPSENIGCIIGKKGEMTKTLSSKVFFFYIFNLLCLILSNFIFLLKLLN